MVVEWQHFNLWNLRWHKNVVIQELDSLMHVHVHAHTHIQYQTKIIDWLRYMTWITQPHLTNMSGKHLNRSFLPVPMLSHGKRIHRPCSLLLISLFISAGRSMSRDQSYIPPGTHRWLPHFRPAACTRLLCSPTLILSHLWWKNKMLAKYLKSHLVL